MSQGFLGEGHSKMASLVIKFIYNKNVRNFTYPVLGVLLLMLSLLLVWQKMDGGGSEPTTHQRQGPRSSAPPSKLQTHHQKHAVNRFEAWAQSLDNHAFPAVARDLLGSLKENPTYAERELRWQLAELFKEWGARDLEKALSFLVDVDLGYEYIRLDPARVMAIAAISGHAKNDVEDACLRMTKMLPWRSHDNAGRIYSGPSFQHPANRVAEQLFGQWWRQSPRHVEAWLVEHGKRSALSPEVLRGVLGQMEKIEDRADFLRRYLEADQARITMRVLPALSAHDYSQVSDFLALGRIVGVIDQRPTKGWLGASAIDQPKDALLYVTKADSQKDKYDRFTTWAVQALEADPVTVIEAIDEHGYEALLDELKPELFVGLAMQRGAHDFWPLDGEEYHVNLASNIAEQIQQAVRKSNLSEDRKADFYRAIHSHAE